MPRLASIYPFPLLVFLSFLYAMIHPHMHASVADSPLTLRLYTIIYLHPLIGIELACALRCRCSYIRLLYMAMYSTLDAGPRPNITSCHNIIKGSEMSKRVRKKRERKKRENLRSMVDHSW
ncbi:hypothetical protein C8Q74DRAFT_618726 [Fomes fomentarius]|nr:hypothetical protein C8Q74DRAFT_618726 [Fomes fomentarius]